MLRTSGPKTESDKDSGDRRRERRGETEKRDRPVHSQDRPTHSLVQALRQSHSRCISFNLLANAHIGKSGQNPSQTPPAAALFPSITDSVFVRLPALTAFLHQLCAQLRLTGSLQRAAGGDEGSQRPAGENLIIAPKRDLAFYLWTWEAENWLLCPRQKIRAKRGPRPAGSTARCHASH